MKIVFTGGGSGGHFYPLIAVAEEIHDIVDKRSLVKPEMFYLSNHPYDEMLLYQNGIEFRHVSAGKMRRYVSLKNGSDALKTLVGLPTALSLLYNIFPDVVFTKGSYTSVPVVLAAWLLRIPVFVHDSDAKPGRANLLAGRFAKRIAISYQEAAEYFSNKKNIACVGHPIRRQVKIPITKDAHEFFKLSPSIKTILVIGGSQGAEHINNTLLQSLGDLLEDFQVIHQTGKANFDSHKEIANVELENHPQRDRYRVFPYLNDTELRSAVGCADLIISRAGSGSIFEIACWNKPSVLVPIPEEVSRDQRKNAYAYARTGATQVIEQHNFTPHVLVAEVRRIMSDSALLAKMVEGAKSFAKPDAAHAIAEELVKIMLEHEYGKK